MSNDEFKKGLDNLNIAYNEDQLNKLERYYELLVDYNGHTNITAITEKKDVYLKHFYDSLTLSQAINLSSINNMLDIGSGAGFPGIIIALFYPNINVTVLDSNNKKTTFMSKVINDLALTNCTVINERAEDYAKNHLNEYDLVTSRAVAYMDIIIELSMPFVNQTGHIVLMKGQLKDELSILDKHLDELNIKSYMIKKSDLIANQERNFVIIQKNKLNHKTMNYSQIKKRNAKWLSK